MNPILLATNNATLDVEDGASGVTAQGVGALRYRDGYFAGTSAALIEEGTTNLIPDPIPMDGTAWSLGTLDPEFGHAYGRSYAVTGGVTFIGPRPLNNWLAPAITPGEPLALSAWVYASVATTIIGNTYGFRVDGVDDETFVDGPDVDVPANAWMRYEVHPAVPSGTTVILTDWAIWFPAFTGTVWIAEAVAEPKDHVTTFCPEFEPDGVTLKPGYAWAVNAHASASTRAATELRIPFTGTIGSVACRYSEDMGQTWQWHYAEALGPIGTYGQIAQVGDELVITSTRALLLGPLAAWADTLTVDEQGGIDALGQMWAWTDIGGQAPRLGGATRTRRARLTASHTARHAVAAARAAQPRPVAAARQARARQVAVTRTNQEDWQPW